MTSLTDTSSAKSGVEITPDDSATMRPTRAIYVGGAGDVRVKFERGPVITMTAATAGFEHPWCVTQVLATGTTATDIVALY